MIRQARNGDTVLLVKSRETAGRSQQQNTLAPLM